MFPGVAAAVHAIAATLPAAAPVFGAAAVGLGIVASHVPEPEIITFKGTPELAAECMKRTAASDKSSLAAMTQPLYGAASYGVVFKRGGVTGDPVMTVLLQESAGGSTAEFRPLYGADRETDLMLKMIAGCRAVPAE